MGKEMHQSTEGGRKPW